MPGHVDDALVVCLIAACLVVLAHGIDAIGSRHSEDGWWHPLALALCGLAICLLIGRLAFVQSTGDAIELLATATAVTVSALPLVGRRGPAGVRLRPANPWDRAYRVTPTRVAQLLSPAAQTRQRPPRVSGRPGTSSASKPQALIGTVLEPAPASPPARPAPQPPGSTDQVGPPAPNGPTQEAAEALHNVDDVLNGVLHLLGLDRDHHNRDRHNRDGPLSP